MLADKTGRNMRGYVALVVFSVIAPVACQSRAMSEESKDSQASCREWDKRVDPRLGDSGIYPDRLPPDPEVLVAISCLLKQRGNKEPARFSGATRPGVSQQLPSATIELAALYYISYLFTGNPQHGDGVALWNQDGVINPPGSADAAYTAYRIWFRRVRSLGLAEARKRRLDPLKGTALRWYGK